MCIRDRRGTGQQQRGWTHVPVQGHTRRWLRRKCNASARAQHGHSRSQTRQTGSQLVAGCSPSDITQRGERC
eukprot:3128897-Alexandrium_andersonii.AAC.1